MSETLTCHNEACDVPIRKITGIRLVRGGTLLDHHVSLVCFHCGHRNDFTGIEEVETLARWINQNGGDMQTEDELSIVLPPVTMVPTPHIKLFKVRT